MMLVADIGGTKIAVARAGDDGELCSDVVSVPTPASRGAAAVVAATVTALQQVRAPDDAAFGIATAGVVDTATGTVLGATSSIAGWAGTPLAAQVGEVLGLPGWVVGDGNAFGTALAADHGARSLVALVAGTGIGGSLVVDGEPLTGAHHAGGHFGHVVAAEARGLRCPCGATGHLEAVASGHGILAWYRANGGDPGVASAHELSLRPDDATAVAALTTGGAALGAVAASLANALDPDLVAVCGSVTRAGAVWETALREAYADTLMPASAGTPVVVADAGPRTALRGAALHALGRMAP
ncbi:ROK family protein [Terrabacter sp. NPDC000476]|uniref:ROK family protein n=1 Tax=Terrabacter sp. NPDC000476 TaxID=3154258 RepID=UPI0033283F8F